MNKIIEHTSVNTNRSADNINVNHVWRAALLCLLVMCSLLALPGCKKEASETLSTTGVQYKVNGKQIDATGPAGGAVQTEVDAKAGLLRISTGTAVAQGTQTVYSLNLTLKGFNGAGNYTSGISAQLTGTSQFAQNNAYAGDVYVLDSTAEQVISIQKYTSETLRGSFHFTVKNGPGSNAPALTITDGQFYLNYKN